MRDAIRVNTDDIANLSKIGESHPESKALQDLVLELYALYSEKIEDPDGPQEYPHSKSDEEVLKGHYDKLGNIYFAKYRANILGAAGGKCAYCHVISAAQIDHFLPISKFSEYSIYSHNLTPICGKCNERKTNRVELPGKGRRYVHPYYDRLPTGQFLTASVEIGDIVILRFKLLVPQGTEDLLAARMRQQFTDLGLGVKYSAEAIMHLRGKRAAIRRKFLAGGQNAVASYLSEEAYSLREEWGRNDCFAVALSALSKSKEFCEGGFEKIPEFP